MNKKEEKVILNKNEQNEDTWTVTIEKTKDSVNFLYEGNVNRYTLIGLMEVEIDMLRKELLQAIRKKD